MATVAVDIYGIIRTACIIMFLTSYSNTPPSLNHSGDVIIIVLALAYILGSYGKKSVVYNFNHLRRSQHY